ncbi:MAG TPA: hypothetical protein VN368_00355, partial [Candidatus Methylomirabilis sp.]|nr:hypothetical protein [Candidatus Methylomirabilis sp.]
HNTALPFSSCGSSSAWWDFHPGGHGAITFFFVLLFVLSLLCFEARVTYPVLEKRGIRAWMLDGLILLLVY